MRHLAKIGLLAGLLAILIACQQSNVDITPSPTATTAAPDRTISGEPVTVGILAIRNAAAAHAQYGALIAYLQETIGRPFVLRPVTQEDQFSLVAAGELDFTFNNPLAAQWLNVTLERQHARDEFTTYARELERSNRELQDFAYVASHDLQEPLRKIQAFGSRMESVYADVLDERGLDYLQRMQRAAHRMQQLIHDLLSYSRVSTRTNPPEPVNLTEIARDVLSDLDYTIERSHGTVHLSELGVVEADPVQMRQLFQNLLGNALKFVHPDRQPVVNYYQASHI